MKESSVFRFFAFLTALFVVACSPKQDYPSPLEGISVPDVTIEADVLTASFEVKSTFANTAARVTDLSTNGDADWLVVKLSRQKIELALKENTTIYDRRAHVLLYLMDGRDDYSNADLTVEFYVTQKKSRKFSGIEIKEVMMNHEKADTIIALPRKLKNVKAEVTDVDGFSIDWCSARLADSLLTVRVNEFRDKGSRHALVKLSPNNGTAMADSTASLAFLVTQCQNPVLDNLDIQPVELTYEGTRQVIKTDRELTGIMAVFTDDETHEKASWCTANVAGDSITVSAQVLNTLSERSGVVTLYLPNHGADIDSTTITTQFAVMQHHNTVFDGVNIPDATMKYNQTRMTFKVTKPMKNISALVVDSKTGNKADWLKVSAVADSVVMTASVHKDLQDRVARVTLYYPNEGGADGQTAVKTTFNVTQRHNTVFEGITIADVGIRFNETTHVMKPGTQLTDIKARVTEVNTDREVSWLKVAVAADSLIFNASVHKDLQNRAARVTLYYPNGKSVTDSTVVKTAFLVTQHHNTIFDGVKISNLTLKYNETRHVLKPGFRMPDIKAQVADAETGAAISWLRASVAGDSVVFTADVLKSNIDREARVTLYYPNGKNVDDESVIKTSFKVAQNHNNVFEGLTIPTHQIDWDKTADTLTIERDLTGIKCLLTDPATNETAKWISATTLGKKIIFKCTKNTALTARSAQVLLYYPDGNDVSSATIRTTFSVTQTKMEQMSVEPKKLTIDYNTSEVKLEVTSNVDFTVNNDKDASWVSYNRMESTGTNTYNVYLKVKQNTTEEQRKAVLTLEGKNGSAAKATFELTQKTNPNITLFDGTTAKVTFRKGGGEFNLPVSTLTPDYKISKSSAWISIGSKVRESEGKYYHKITVQRFSGEGPLRSDTIIVKNNEVEQKLIVEQDKYLYLNESEKEVEAGASFQLTYKNHTANTVTWKSSNEKVAKVDANGWVTTIDHGTANITISIGTYNGIPNYSDYCQVKVFDASDKVSLQRGNGNYVKNDDMVTSNCPVVVSNGYNKSITLISAEIIGQKVQIDGNDSKLIDVTIPAVTPLSSQTVSPNGTFTVSFGSIENIYKPKVIVKFMANSKEYQKQMNY